MGRSVGDLARACAGSLLVLATWACSDSDSDEPAADAAASSPDAGADCSLTGLEPDADMAERDDELQVLFYTATEGDLRLTVDFYFSLGATDGAQSVTLTGEGLDTCATCVFAHSGCGELVCVTAFVAVSGQLEISAMGGVGERFTGQLDQARFAEAVIEPGTQETTLVDGGQTWCFDSYAFDVSVLGS